MKVLIACVLLGLSQAFLQADSLGELQTADCNNIDPESKAWVDAKIAGSKAYLVASTTCGWCTYAVGYLKKMGFSDSDIVIDYLDDLVEGAPNRTLLYDYVYCKETLTARAVPQIYMNTKFMGGATETRHAYYTGEGARAAFDSGAVIFYSWYHHYLKQAAMEFVKDGVARSAEGHYFMLSKEVCSHCLKAKKCFAAAGILLDDIEIFEINDFETHDEIKLYKKRLTGSPYTPLLAYNGHVLNNHDELVEATGCVVPENE